MIRRLTVAVIFWSVTRLGRGIWGAFDSYYFETLIVSMTHIEVETMTAPVLTILLFLVTEILPMIYV